MPEPPPPDRAPAESPVTRLLVAARSGDGTAAVRLFEVVYDDLRQIARRHVRGAAGIGGAGGSPRSATSLVHEVFLRIAKRGELPFHDRDHFFAIASRAMRQVIIDTVRERRAGKRGAGQVVDMELVSLAAPAAAVPPEELLALDRALERLENDAPRLARTVEWHFFGGLTFDEIAAATSVSRSTVERDWRAARAILHLDLAGRAVGG